MKLRIKIILCVLTLAHEGWSEYGDRIKNATVVWGENLQMEESRYGDYSVAPPPTELPVTFQAPYINAPNYWPNSPRRTVLDYQPYAPQDIITRPLTEGINTFYGLMNQFFGVEEATRRPPPHQPPTRQQRPDFEYPYHPQNLRPFYLPGPKPLRASIQKLEPSRNNNISPQRPNNNYHPQFVKILNDVLVENAFNNREPVIEKPVYEYESVIPTTYKPNRFKFRTSTTPPTFPVSIQDQLPPVTLGQDTRIPYVTETTTVQTIRPTSPSKVIFPVETESIPPLDYSIDVRNANVPIAKPEDGNISWHPPTTPVVEITTNGESGINTTSSEYKSTTENTVEILNTTNNGTNEKLKQEESNVSSTTENSIITTTDLLTTIESITQIPLEPQQSIVQSMATEILDTMEPLYNDRTRSQFPKKLHSRKVTTDSTNSADYVTDLTLQGLNDSKAVHVSVPKRFKPFNMSYVLDYVIGELNATAPPLNALSVDDGLSLDAKILKDTNWDGYQPVIPTTEKFTETTTVWTTVPTTLPTTTDIPITTVSINVEAEETTTTSPRTKRLRITTTPVVPVRRKLVTTTVYPEISVTTAYPMTTTESITAPFEKQTEVIATRVTQTVSKSLRQRQRSRTTTTEEPVISPRGLDQENSSTEFTSTTRKGRKYQRRPKSQSFTQFSSKATTLAPLKLGTLNRPFYPKRSRPNTTLTFSNRGSVKLNEDSEERKPKKISSAEETTARKNLYKRRKYPSHLRKTSTEESLVQS